MHIKPKIRGSQTSLGQDPLENILAISRPTEWHVY